MSSRKSGSVPSNPAAAEAGAASGKGMQIATWAAVLVVVGGMTALLTSMQGDGDAALAGDGPGPWSYNAVTNQHWDPRPGHVHWHAGPPPAESERGVAATSVEPGQTISPDDPLSQTPVGDAIQNQPAFTGEDDLPPNLKNPRGWQYDAGNNQHWHEEHGHWHDGPPPQGVDGALRIPEDWAYDAVNDRHWQPTHRHWHAGAPPRQ